MLVVMLVVVLAVMLAVLLALTPIPLLFGGWHGPWAGHISHQKS
jgi:hypothetical protein